jgi:hypothetical protein
MASAPLTTGRIVRAFFAAATFVFLGAALMVRTDPRLYAASAAFGTIWWLWDLLMAYVVEPLGEWFVRQVLGGGIGAAPSDLRPDLDDTIRLLEAHLARGGGRHVDINAAVRLEEMYRLAKKDVAQARRVIAIVRERYPDAPELDRYEGDGEDDKFG